MSATGELKLTAALARFRTTCNEMIETGKQIPVTRVRNGKPITETVRLSASTLADAMHVTTETASNWMKGMYFPELATMIKMFMVLGLSLDDIFDMPKPDMVARHKHDFVWFVRQPKRELFAQFGEEYDEICTGIDYFERAMDRPTESGFRENRGFIVARRQNGHLAIDQVPRDHDMEEDLIAALQTTLSMKLARTDVLVAKLPEHGLPLSLAMECVAFVASRHCLRSPRLAEDTVGIGVASGYTLLRFSEQVIPSSDRYRQLVWGALLTERDPGASYTHHTARSIVSIQQNRHPAGTGIAPLYFVDPHAQDDSARDMRATHEEAWGQVKAVFTAITLLARRGRDDGMSRQFMQWGEHEPKMFTRLYNTLVKSNAIDDVCALFQGHLLREDGSQYPMPESIASDLYGVSFNFNQRLVDDNRPVWMLAAGAHKAKPILAALRGRHINRLCIDSDAARALLTLLERT